MHPEYVSRIHEAAQLASDSDVAVLVVGDTVKPSRATSPSIPYFSYRK